MYINSEDLMLREIGQSQKEKYCKYFHLYEVCKIVKFVKLKRNSVCQGLRGGRNREVLIIGICFQSKKISTL